MDSSFSSVRGTAAKRLRSVCSVCSVQFSQFSSRTVPALTVTLTLAGTRYYNILDSTRGVDLTPSSLAPDWAKAPVKKTACCLLRDEADDTRLQGPASAVAVRLVSLRSDLWPENDISKVNRGHPRSFTCDEVICHFSGFCAPGIVWCADFAFEIHFSFICVEIGTLGSW